ncbi:MAG: lipoprotein-releasing system ATP-binding protein [Puniceicoccaceae bacterium 5H]|nr:MAG: lipoprotein-releasing system ATP-binding protein [Puniceicoccaceae bacterium 5H]
MSETSTQKSVVLQTRQLTRYLGDGANRQLVLDALDLDLHAGQTCAVVGPSGCGKSTLLYLLGLLDRPNEGTIHVQNREMAAADDTARTAFRNEHIGFVFQFHFLLPEFTALENLLLPMRKLGRWGDEEMRERATELLTRFGLGDKVNRYTNQLSGGEQQRVAVARALANEPTLILADEPTGNLDTRNSNNVMELLQEAAHAYGPSILIVTHNPELAQACDRLLTMRDGRFESEQG